MQGDAEQTQTHRDAAEETLDLKNDRENTLKRVARILALLPKRPIDVYDRLSLSVANRSERLREAPVYEANQWHDVLEALEVLFAEPVDNVLHDPAFHKLEETVRDRIGTLPENAPWSQRHNADFTFATACFLLCRVLKPNIVIETGVAYGVSSSFMLQALEMNGRGTLHSIDLPPSIEDNAVPYVGYLIPEHLKPRWELHRGTSKRVLPPLLAQLGQVDMFVHDSLHTYRNMLWEFQTVTPCLPPEAALIADDIGGNPAFLEWVTDADPVFRAVVHEEDKAGMFGIGVFSESN